MGRMKDHVMADIMSQSIDEQLAEPTPPTRTLYQALSAAQAEMRNPTFDKVNPHFKSKFASLAAVRDAVVPVLARHGIAMTQTYDFYEGAQVLVTTLYYGDDRIESQVPLPAYQQPQQWASATTYIRRVSLMAIAGVCGDEDDDAEEATQTARKSPQGAAPAGFATWWADMQAVADDGSDALRTAWMAASADFRNHVQSAHSSEWAALKTKAGRVAA